MKPDPRAAARLAGVLVILAAAFWWHAWMPAVAVVAFDCRLIEVKAVASHDIYFGVVEAIHSGPAGAALVYHDRAYKQV